MKTYRKIFMRLGMDDLLINVSNITIKELDQKLKILKVALTK